MNQQVRSVYWEAPEHNHIEKTSDWFWIVGIIAVAGAVASILLGNALFGIVIILASVTMMVYGNREPRVFVFEISNRGVRVENDLYRYDNLESFCLDEDAPLGPQLIVKPNKLFSQLIIVPVPEDKVEEIEAILEARLPEVHLEEPFSHQVMEYLGF